MAVINKYQIKKKAVIKFCQNKSMYVSTIDKIKLLADKQF